MLITRYGADTNSYPTECRFWIPCLKSVLYTNVSMFLMNNDRYVCFYLSSTNCVKWNYIFGTSVLFIFLFCYSSSNKTHFNIITLARIAIFHIIYIFILARFFLWRSLLLNFRENRLCVVNTYDSQWYVMKKYYTDLKTFYPFSSSFVKSPRFHPCIFDACDIIDIWFRWHSQSH